MRKWMGLRAPMNTARLWRDQDNLPLLAQMRSIGMSCPYRKLYPTGIKLRIW
jgi:hypothetical protein